MFDLCVSFNDYCHFIHRLNVYLILQLYIKIMAIHCDFSKTTIYSLYQINMGFHLCDIVARPNHNVTVGFLFSSFSFTKHFCFI